MKKQTNLSPSASKKVEKIYQAIMELMDEGCDINTLKVADITTRAGIGKGTAYEYFESKEEILSNAIEYDLQKQFDSLCSCNRKVESFREQVMVTFQWIEKNMDGGGRRMHSFVTGQLPCNVSSEIFRRMNEGEDKHMRLQQFLEIQRESARREGLWKEKSTLDFLNLALVSAYIEYFLYVLHRKEFSQSEDADVKEFIFESLKERMKLL